MSLFAPRLVVEANGYISSLKQNRRLCKTTVSSVTEVLVLFLPSDHRNSCSLINAPCPYLFCIWCILTIISRFYNDVYQTIGGIFLDEYYFRPSIIQEDKMFDAMLRGLATQPQQSEDTFFSVTVSVSSCTCVSIC